MEQYTVSWKQLATFCDFCRYLDGHPAKLTVAGVMNMLEQQDIQFTLARIQPKATQLMQDRFVEYYNDQQLNFEIKPTNLFNAEQLQTSHSTWSSFLVQLAA